MGVCPSRLFLQPDSVSYKYATRLNSNKISFVPCLPHCNDTLNSIIMTKSMVVIFAFLLVDLAMAQNKPAQPITAAEAAPAAADAAKESLQGSEAVYLAHPYGAHPYPYAAYPYAAYPYGAYPYAAVPYGYPYPFFRR
ncbi:uncharacterized protein LOC120349788 isoform X1 [Nilaparvata lugens]|uniref:uncharacterized protein LOC120349788 isoform X1 n=1 Tax=Nilaparvata lugens TaxID=108931 RepID=UPI00193EB78B|nr:uncharacterized protein LOC120349788 isoform X1 [Nilaparvata lugens]